MLASISKEECIQNVQDLVDHAHSVLTDKEEGEHTWSDMDEELSNISQWFNNQSIDLSQKKNAFQLFMHQSHNSSSLAFSISRCISSDRSKLSGTAIELLQVLSRFSSMSMIDNDIISEMFDIFMANLIKLTQRTNKVFVQRSIACMESILSQQSLNITIKWIPIHFQGMLSHANKTVRGASMQCIFHLLNNSRNELSTIMQPYLDILLDCINSGLHDAAPDVRSKATQAFESLKKLFQERANEFLRMASPHIQKVLRFSSNNKPDAESQIKPKSIFNRINIKHKESNDQVNSEILERTENLSLVDSDIPLQDISTIVEFSPQSQSPSPIPIHQSKDIDADEFISKTGIMHLSGSGPAKVVQPPQRLGTAMRIALPGNQSHNLPPPKQVFQTKYFEESSKERSSQSTKNDKNMNHNIHKTLFPSNDPNWMNRVSAVDRIYNTDDFLTALSDHHPRVIEATLSKLPESFELFDNAQIPQQAKLVCRLFSLKKELCEPLIHEFSKRFNYMDCAAILITAFSMIQNHSHRRILFKMVHDEISKEEIKKKKAGNAFKIIMSKLPWNDRFYLNEKPSSLLKNVLVRLYNYDSDAFIKYLPNQLSGNAMIQEIKTISIS